MSTILAQGLPPCPALSPSRPPRGGRSTLSASNQPRALPRAATAFLAATRQAPRLTLCLLGGHGVSVKGPGTGRRAGLPGRCRKRSLRGKAGPDQDTQRGRALPAGLGPLLGHQAGSGPGIMTSSNSVRTPVVTTMNPFQGLPARRAAGFSRPVVAAENVRPWMPRRELCLGAPEKRLLLPNPAAPCSPAQGLHFFPPVAFF